MPASLAETLYAAWATAPTAFRTLLPFAELPIEHQRAWEAVAEAAITAVVDTPVDQLAPEVSARLVDRGMRDGQAAVGAVNTRDLATLTATGAEFSCRDCGKTVEVDAVRCSGCVAERRQPAIVGYRCACGVDHYFETREQVANERDQIRRDYLDVADALLPRSEGPADLVAEARRLRAEVERLARERGELIAYIDAAKCAAGDRRVSGEPLATFIERLVAESDQEAWK